MTIIYKINYSKFDKNYMYLKGGAAAAAAPPQKYIDMIKDEYRKSSQSKEDLQKYINKVTAGAAAPVVEAVPSTTKARPVGAFSIPNAAGEEIDYDGKEDGPAAAHAYLGWASGMGYPKAAQRALENGANPFKLAYNDEGLVGGPFSAEMVARARGHDEVLEIFADMKPQNEYLDDVNQTPLLLQAVAEGNVSEVRRLLDHGYDPRLKRGHDPRKDNRPGFYTHNSVIEAIHRVADKKVGKDGRNSRIIFELIVHSLNDFLTRDEIRELILRKVKIPQDVLRKQSEAADKKIKETADYNVQKIIHDAAAAAHHRTVAAADHKVKKIIDDAAEEADQVLKPKPVEFNKEDVYFHELNFGKQHTKHKQKKITCKLTSKFNPKHVNINMKSHENITKCSQIKQKLIIEMKKQTRLGWTAETLWDFKHMRYYPDNRFVSGGVHITLDIIITYPVIKILGYDAETQRLCDEYIDKYIKRLLCHEIQHVHIARRCLYTIFHAFTTDINISDEIIERIKTAFNRIQQEFDSTSISNHGNQEVPLTFQEKYKLGECQSLNSLSDVKLTKTAITSQAPPVTTGISKASSGLSVTTPASSSNRRKFTPLVPFRAWHESTSRISYDEETRARKYLADRAAHTLKYTPELFRKNRYLINSLNFNGKLKLLNMGIITKSEFFLSLSSEESMRYFKDLDHLKRQQQRLEYIARTQRAQSVQHQKNKQQAQHQKHPRQKRQKYQYQSRRGGYSDLKECN